jgi:hypothetical protein
MYMVEASLQYSNNARHRILRVNPAGDRDKFMKSIRQWIAYTPALIAQNLGVNRLNIANVAFQNIPRNVTISWTFGADQGKYIVIVEVYQP